MKPLFLLVQLIQQEYPIKFSVAKKVTTDTDLLIKVTDMNQKKMTNRSLRAVFFYLKLNTSNQHFEKSECFFIALKSVEIDQFRMLKGGDRMKIRVTTAFNDKQNGYVTRPVNEVFECSEQRAKELIDSGFAEEVKPDAPKKPKTKAD